MQNQNERSEKAVASDVAEPCPQCEAWRSCAVGVSGDTSCTDYDVAWRVRNNLGLDHLLGVGVVSGDANHPDNIIYDIIANPDGTGGTGKSPAGPGGVGTSPSGFGHPKCLNTGNPAALPVVQP